MRAGFELTIISNGRRPWAGQRPGESVTLPSRDLELHLTRVLDAPPPRVWQNLTEPGQLARWWGPAGFSCPSVELDVRVGGRYRIAMQPPGGAAFFLEGEFREVIPPSRLSYTFRWEPPDPADQETLATLSLTDRGGTTELALDQRPFATRERLELHERGWTESLDRLARHLIATRSGPGVG